MEDKKSKSGIFKDILTDPKEYNENDFIFIVSGIPDYSNVTKKLETIKDPTQFYSACLVGSLDKNAVSEKFGIEREIYQVGTMYPMGLIIEPFNDKLIKIAWNCDLGSPTAQKELKEYVEKHGGKIKGPIWLLIDTKGPADIKWNELIIQGDKETEVTGVYYREGIPTSKYIAEGMKKYVEDFTGKDVPIVGIPPLSSKIGKLEELASSGEHLSTLQEFHNPQLFKQFIYELKPFRNPRL